MTRPPAFRLPDGYQARELLSFEENRAVVRASAACGPVVLKCLLPPFDDEEAGGFRREYLLLDALAHPFWVRPERFLPLPDSGFAIVLEEAPGAPLSEFPDRCWSAETLEIARRVLSGLAALHHLGVAQLDLKPLQVLAGRTGDPERLEVRMLDLGLAAPFGDPVQGRGTPGFMAPEIVRGERGWDARVDLYAAGAVLFDLFTGRPAFPGSSAREILDAQVRGVVPDPGDAVPPAVRLIIRELLSPDPAERPPDAVEVWRRLRTEAGPERVGELPALLTGSPGFTFHGRRREVERFDRFRAESGPAERTFRVTGEKGIGRRRLLARLAAVAQADGWVLEEPGREDSGNEEPAQVLVRLVDGHEERIRMRSGPAGGSEATAAGGTVPPAATEAEVALDPLDRETLLGMLRARGMESEALREALASEAMGSPGLLQALAGQIPRELDLAARVAEEEAIRESFREAPAPDSWVAWIGNAVADLPEKAIDLLVLLALAGAVAPGGLERLAGTSCPALDRLLARGLLVEAAGTLRVRSGIWERAILAAEPERTARLGARLLREPILSSTARARLALRLGDPEILREHLSSALAELHAAGRFEEELLLFTQAAAALPERPSLLCALGEAGIRTLLSTSIALGYGIGTLQGIALEPMLAQAGRPDCGRLLCAWQALARNDLAAAKALLDFEPAHPEDRFYRRWFRARAEQRAGRFQEALDDLERMRREGVASLPGAELWLRAAQAGMLLERTRFEEAAALLEEGRPCLDSLSPGDRAVYLHTSACVAMRRGDERTLAADSVEAERLFRESGFARTRLYAAMLLGSIAFERGDLTTAQVWIEDVLRSRVARGEYEQAVTAITNLSLVLLEQGRLGLALRAVRDGAEFAARAGTERSLLRVGRREAEVLAYVGMTERARQTAERLLGTATDKDPVRGAFLRAILGVALFDSGRPEEARIPLRCAVDAFLESGALEDALETLVSWGLHESAHGEIAEARERWGEMAGIADDVPPMQQGTLRLLEGELCRAAGAAEDALGPLEEAVRTLEAQQRWYHAWRARWRRAQAEADCGMVDGALEDYAAARTILESLRASLEAPAAERRFLRLPAVSAFLRELDEG